MSHIHIPDGVLPVWLWAGAFALMALLVLLGLIRLGLERRRFLPTAAAVSALCIVAMSIEIGGFYHMNLTAVAGILIPPFLTPLVAFIINFILALMGHGGVTVVGLNSLVTALEMTVAGLAYRALSRRWKPSRSAWLATFVALAVSTTLVLALVLFLRGGGYAVQMEVMGSFTVSEGLIVILVYGVAVIGWVIEATLVSLLINLIARVRPQMLEVWK